MFIPDVVDIILGKYEDEVIKSSEVIVDIDSKRFSEFRDQCDKCQIEGDTKSRVEVTRVPLGGGTNVTPQKCIGQHQLEESPNNYGQWTRVVNRKKNPNLGCPHERVNMEH
jgi:hypothetical protein